MKKFILVLCLYALIIYSQLIYIVELKQPAIIAISICGSILFTLLSYLLAELERFNKSELDKLNEIIKETQKANLEVKKLLESKSVKTGFTISEADDKKIEKWRKKLPKLPDTGQMFPPYRHYTYEFTPTGIGNGVKVTTKQGDELDLTDISNW